MTSVSDTRYEDLIATDPNPDLTDAARAMRRDHGWTHKRHKMWHEMATLLDSIASEAPRAAILDAARQVADAYRDAPR